MLARSNEVSAGNSRDVAVAFVLAYLPLRFALAVVDVAAVAAVTGEAGVTVVIAVAAAGAFVSVIMPAGL